MIVTGWCGCDWGVVVVLLLCGCDGMVLWSSWYCGLCDYIIVIGNSGVVYVVVTGDGIVICVVIMVWFM